MYFAFWLLFHTLQQILFEHLQIAVQESCKAVICGLNFENQPILSGAQISSLCEIK